MKIFSVSFKYSENTYCCNIVIAENTEIVKEKYSKYEWFSIKECNENELEIAKRKGMPILKLLSTPKAY